MIMRRALCNNMSQYSVHQSANSVEMAAVRMQKPSAVCAIFFDLDNTLIQTRKADLKACSKVAEFLQSQHGVPHEVAIASTSTYLKAFRLCPDNPQYDLDAWRLLLWTQSLPSLYAPLSREVYLKWLHLRYKYLSVGDDILNLLQSLRRQYLLGLITNGPSTAQWEKIQRLNLGSLFDCILVSGDLPWEKPDEKIFQEACQFLGVEPKQCIMVGDKLETDIQGGIVAQLGFTVWMPIEKSATLDLAITPDYTINCLSELLRLLPPCAQRPPAFRSNSLGKRINPCGPNLIQNRRVQSLPDLDDCNSNSSDGS